MATFNFTVSVQTERESGKFASSYDIRSEIREALESANPDEISGIGADGESIYNIVEWDVQDA